MLKTFNFALALLVVPGMAMATPVYKYFLKENDLIADTCTEDGDSLSSKLNMSFAEPAANQVQTRLRIKACTHKYGLKKFTFNLPMPVQLFDETVLLGHPVGKTLKVGAHWLTREANVNGRAVYSLSPDSFGEQADGVQSIRFFVTLDPVQREALLAKSQGRFVWSGISITYKKGFLMPTVRLQGDFTLVEDETL
ncbi:hypothetical protein [Bdellovibrio bacteriovorus]|uniref:Uncharacterized protein n=1 Tax=Bdellovibrio bacteriovorus str. Tiberius TaxID=1069642 RepID=K7ZGD9_BDEBC|nr:hypothetical protein [Bdellovibrio bacteriovorus]AFY02377.1 Hypothetical protein Bdt_2695 [Bdellovibrio bacteriovorus str. Tiberius]